MSYQGFKVVDADSHFREYLDIERTYRDNIDPEYREAFERLSRAVAARRAAGQSTDLFMGPLAIIEPSDEWRPRSAFTTASAPNGQLRRA
jgi:hypothetical protein